MEQHERDRVKTSRSPGDRAARRAILQTAMMAAAGGVAAVMTGGTRVSATPGAMRYGDVNDAGGWLTKLISDFNVGKNFTVETTTTGTNPDLAAIYGNVSGREATGGSIKGVVGQADGGLTTLATGVAGTAKADRVRAMGVVGNGRGSPGIGVLGDGDGVGVQGQSVAGTAVLGDTGGGTGVLGQAAKDGIAVKAVNGSGVALSVEGSAEFAADATFGGTVVSRDVQAALFAGAEGGLPVFSGAGKSGVTKGKDRIRIRAPLVTRDSTVIVVLQTDPGPVSLRYVKPGNGFFDVVLTGAAPRRTAFGHFAQNLRPQRE